MVTLEIDRMETWNRLVILLDSYFCIGARGSSFMTEFRAGTTTFLTMSYILLVNPQILSKTGLLESDVVIATALASAFGSILCGITANLPFGLAPGLGLSAYLAYGLVLGTGMRIEEALTSCLIAGLLNSIIAGLGLADRLMQKIPDCIKYATIVGMGLLLTLIGLSNVKLVVKDEHGLVQMGDLWSTDVILAMAGLLFISTLQLHNIKGGILIGIAIVALLSWSIEDRWPKGFVDIPRINQSFARIDFSSVSGKMIPSIIAFMAVGIFDVSGVMFALARIADLLDPMGNVERGSFALLSASIATVFAALLGCSPIIVHLESAAGAKEGAKTGFAAVVTGLWFFLSLFFAPIFGAVPAAATAPVLVFIGASMTELSHQIQWKNVSDGVPAFLTMVLMPFTFSIPDGIFFGVAFKFGLWMTSGEALVDLGIVSRPSQEYCSLFLVEELEGAYDDSPAGSPETA